MDNSNIENNEPKEKADFYTNLQKEWDSMTEEDRMSYGEFFALDDYLEEMLRKEGY